MDLSVLLLTHQAPPAASSAARRPAGLAVHLARLGVGVEVISSAISGRGPVPGARYVTRTPDLLESGLNWRRANTVALTRGGGDATAYAAAHPLTNLLVPEVTVATWAPFALGAALRAIRRRRPTALLTSGPPHSVHVAGAALRAATGIPWIAELQDGWAFEPSAPARPATVIALDHAVERLVLARADALIGISAPIGDDLAARFGADRGLTLPLAFEPDEVEAARRRVAARGGTDVLLDATRTSLVYTGTLAYGGAPVGALAEGLRRLPTAAAARLELVVAGPSTNEERAELETAAPGVVRFVGSVDRDRVLELHQAADALLVLADPRRTSILTNKLVEYLGASAPILVLGDTSAAARLVRERCAGEAVALGEPDGVAQALVRAADRTLEHTPDPHRGDPVRYDAVARELVAIVRRIAR